ncbi:hypothetical protein IG631_17947 [Alternaria alternata]|nr:hypothetical protein IG631_17947 [Alternaria alternata]
MGRQKYVYTEETLAEAKGYTACQRWRATIESRNRLHSPCQPPSWRPARGRGGGSGRDTNETIRSLPCTVSAVHLLLVSVYAVAPSFARLSTRCSTQAQTDAQNGE